jgi:hypothetical protein
MAIVKITKELKDMMSQICDIDELDMLTADEKSFNEEFVAKLRTYGQTNGVSGVELKQLNAAASTIAKRQQSRSAIAVLRWSMAKDYIESKDIPEAVEVK